MGGVSQRVPTLSDCERAGVRASNLSSGLTQTEPQVDQDSTRGLSANCNHTPEVLWLAWPKSRRKEQKLDIQRDKSHPEPLPGPCWGGRRPLDGDDNKERQPEAGTCAAYPTLSTNKCGERRPTIIRRLRRQQVSRRASREQLVPSSPLVICAQCASQPEGRGSYPGRIPGSWAYRGKVGI